MEYSTTGIAGGYLTNSISESTHPPVQLLCRSYCDLVPYSMEQGKSGGFVSSVLLDYKNHSGYTPCVNVLVNGNSTEHKVMTMNHPAAIRLKENFPNIGLQAANFRGQIQISVPPAHFLPVVTFLRDDPTLRYDLLVDVTCVDYLNFPSWNQPRFGLVYIFSSVEKDTPRLIVRVFLNENALEIPSLVPLFAGAEWLEREAFDMFGITFTGHPDLRRILTWDSFKSYPLRKDYPVTGLGERENYPVITRQDA